MRIAMLIFDGLTALDAVGPYEVLARLPGVELTFVATERGAKRTDTARLALTADARLEELPRPNVLVVPGGEGNRPLMRDEEVLGWIREAHRSSDWTASVCTGSLLLGAAGVLDGLRATSHWAFRERLRKHGAHPIDERVVEDGRVITAAGVSAGIDMALVLAARIAGERVARAIQLGIEYDPDPPFDSGSPERAAPDLVELVRGLEAGDERDPGA